MDFLLYFAALKGIPKVQAKRKAKELLNLVSLEDVGRKKIKTFSGGMKQRLVHRPESKYHIKWYLLPPRKFDPFYISNDILQALCLFHQNINRFY